MGSRIFAAVAALATLLPSGALAQDVEADLRASGRVALREGRFEEALSAFQQAAFQSRDPSTWLEVGDAADRLRQDEAALDAYRRYLAARPDAPDRAEVAARVEVLERVVAEPRRAGSVIGETHRRGLMPTRPRGGAAQPIGEARRRGIISAAEIVDAIRRGGAGRELAVPSD